MEHFRIGCLILIVIILMCLTYEPFLNLREGLTSLEKDNKTMQKCYDLEKDYNIVVDKTWGSAPYKAKKEWTDNHCDKVVNNIQKCRDWESKYNVEVDKSWGSAPHLIREEWTKNNCNDAVRLHVPITKTTHHHTNTTVNDDSNANNLSSHYTDTAYHKEGQKKHPTYQMKHDAKANYTCNCKPNIPTGIDNTNKITFNTSHTNKSNQISCNCDDVTSKKNNKKNQSCDSDSETDSDSGSGSGSGSDSDSDTKSKKCKKRNKRNKRNNFVKRKSITGLFTETGIPAAYPYQLSSSNY